MGSHPIKDQSTTIILQMFDSIKYFICLVYYDTIIVRLSLDLIIKGN